MCGGNAALCQITLSIYYITVEVLEVLGAVKFALLSTVTEPRVKTVALFFCSARLSETLIFAVVRLT